MVRYHIRPLEEDEVKDYINHRLNIAGSNNRIRFTDEALKIISDFSGGIPRLINIVCDRALLAGFVQETNTIDLNILDRCMEELKPELKIG
jgi:general secretion pathway protein A